MTTVYVKGGMPVDVEGDVTEGGSNSYGSDEPAWIEVDNVEIYWHGSARPVTQAFKDSLSAADWETINESLIEGAGGW